MSPDMPDWIIVGPSGFIFREVKGEHVKREVQTGSARPNWRQGSQALNDLSTGGGDAKVWTADDWRSGLILDELGALR